jgi:hypothetical protein
MHSKTLFRQFTINLFMCSSFFVLDFGCPLISWCVFFPDSAEFLRRPGSGEQQLNTESDRRGIKKYARVVCLGFARLVLALRKTGRGVRSKHGAGPGRTRESKEQSRQHRRHTEQKHRTETQNPTKKTDTQRRHTETSNRSEAQTEQCVARALRLNSSTWFVTRNRWIHVFPRSMTRFVCTQENAENCVS